MPATPYRTRPLALAALVLAACLPLAATGWAQSVPLQTPKVRFAVKSLGRTIQGEFTRSQIFVDWQDDPRYCQFTAHVETHSLTTGNPNRDETLRQVDYFHANVYPEIRFQSLRVSAPTDATRPHVRRVRAALTVRGVTREVYVSVVRTGRVIEATFTLNRRDFGVGPDTWRLADEVTLTVAGTLPPEPDPMNPTDEELGLVPAGSRAE